MLGLWLVSLAGSALLAQAPSPHRNTETIKFSDLRGVPDDRILLSETSSEAWYFVPSWSESGLVSAPREGASVNARPGPYRYRSPFAVFEKKSGRWRSAAVSRLAFEIYPALIDTVDPSLIWFGIHDSRGSIIDWVGDFKAASVADQPLVFSYGPTGLGLIDTAKRAVSYFGEYRDLVGGGVTRLLFDKDAVWAWGRQPGSAQLNGLARFDRQTRTIQPFPVRPHGYTDWWQVLTLTATESSVSLSVVDRDGWFKRHEFDKSGRQWKQLRFAWVSSADLPLYAEPEDRSKTVDVLHPGMHFGNQGHGHNGHPLVVLEERDGWQRVTTCTDVIGWTRSGALVDSLEFFRLTLNSPAARRDRGSNDGPRMFVFQAHQYMSDEMKEQIPSVVRDSELATLLKNGRLDPQEAAEAERLLAVDQYLNTNREYVRNLWDSFMTKRQALLRK